MRTHWPKSQGDPAWRGRNQAYENGERSGPEAGYEGSYEGGYAGRQRPRAGGRGTGAGQTGESGGYQRRNDASGHATPYAGAYLSPVEGYHPQGRGGLFPEREADWDRGSYRRESGYKGDTRRTLPKGYTPSDERILEDVCERLSRSGLDVADVEVDVQGGEVTLKGAVTDRHMKHMVEDLVADCNGVHDVENRLKIRPGATGQTVESFGSDA